MISHAIRFARRSNNLIVANACLWGLMPLSIWCQCGRRNPNFIRTVAGEKMFPYLFGIAVFVPCLRIAGAARVSDLLRAINILLAVATGMYVCTSEKAFRLEDMQTPIEHNGYYVSMAFWMIILSGTGLGLTLAFVIGAGLSPFSQSLIPQLVYFIIMLFSEHLAMPATDKNRFAIVMFAIYLQVDSIQTLLYLQSDNVLVHVLLDRGRLTLQECWPEGPDYVAPWSAEEKSIQ